MLLRWLLNSLLILVLPYIVPGISVANFWTALLVALVFGILNALVKPILIILTLPVTILSLGLFVFILNAILLWFTSTIVKGFEIRNFSAAVLAALVLWVGSMLVNLLTKQKTPRTF
ncbi:MAG: phage holin family protein [Candidatus Kerfeldbacteria bacterium]|nr:phage holin family protein [Candidatus Kerfeldbacteria bacterium]